MYVYNCTTKTSTNLPFSESEHAWHKILRGAGHGDIASGPRIADARAASTGSPRRHKPAAGVPGVPWQLVSWADTAGSARWFRKGPAGGLAEYVGELS